MDLPEVIALMVAAVAVAAAMSALVVSIAVRWVHRGRAEPEGPSVGR